VQLSDDTTAVLSALNEAVEGGLRKLDDIGVLLELAATHEESDLFNNTVRTGTALWKVHSTLRRLQRGDEGFRQLEQEFALQINELREHLAQLMHHADDTTLHRFDDIYFGMSQGVVRNLIDIAHDLHSIKKLQM